MVDVSETNIYVQEQLAPIPLSEEYSLMISTLKDIVGFQPSKSQGKTSDVDSSSIQGNYGSVVATPTMIHSVTSSELASSDQSEQLRHGYVIPEPAKPVLKASKLVKTYFVLPQSSAGGSAKVFVDRKLPISQVVVEPNQKFGTDYFIALHKLVAAPGPYWPAGTPNHLGARIPLQHSGLNMDRWRYHLTGYDDGSKEILQLIEYGFPLGLSGDPSPTLVSTLTNHGSAYNFYPFWDEFVAKGVEHCDLVGGFSASPFQDVHISPLMTAEKKPSSRRCVFDATFGDFSLNNSTPQDQYLGQQIDYSFPRIEDFRQLILSCGRGCWIWKRDLARYFLQIPLDPLEFPLVAFVWRAAIYFFIKLMFGLRNSGYQAQRLSEAIVWIHKRLGLETDLETFFNSLVYVDDFGGCEESELRAIQSSQALHKLLIDLGLEESVKKEHKPSNLMPFLGVNFDTLRLEMSVPHDKLAEVCEEVSLWEKKSTATKRTLQQLLGKLMWVSKCVRFSRPFMGRLLGQLKTMHHLPCNKKTKLSDSCKLDIKWWARFLRRFNGVQMMFSDDPLLMSLDDLAEVGAIVNCGDAQMMGGGSYYDDEYWSRPFPRWLQDPQIFIHLKEFWVVLVSAWIWGDKWRGKLVYIFSDNDSVVETLLKEKPKDIRMQELLREFLYVVCIKGFTPAFRKIGTKENFEADYISRVHNYDDIHTFAIKHSLPIRKPVEAPDHLFQLNSNW